MMSFFIVLLSRIKTVFFLVLAAAICGGCGSSTDEQDRAVESQRAEYISRKSADTLHIPFPYRENVKDYPWRSHDAKGIPAICKEHFRCRGKNTNPHKTIEDGEGSIRIFDCAGIEDHGLPLRDQKEFVYPILIDLLNFIQSKTQKRVIVTSGHRCPQHNRYNDSSSKAQYSKHMIGAEVAFYVVGLEDYPERIVNLLQEYYREREEYKGAKEYLEFQRWDKKGVTVEVLPWYNKEIFIKLFKKHEGRDVDNSHPFPYISIQVRYDRARQQTVSYTWDGAFYNYWRW